MKPLMKKILESGLVDRRVAAMLEGWGQLEPGAMELVGQKQLTEENLKQFAEEIDELVSTEREQLRETRFEIKVSGPHEVWVDDKMFSAYRDEFGRYLVSETTDPSIFASEDTIIIDGKLYEVLDFEVLYRGEAAAAIEIRVGDEAIEDE